MANFATFRIKRVKCRDEMGGQYREMFGNDEIQCAVFSADLRGSTVNSGRIDIYADFDDGDEKRFDPPREVATLDLAGKSGPVELSFSVLLIESQLTEGSGLEKAWDAFVALYMESLKEQLSMRQISLEEARAVAKPGYLRPRSSSLTPSPVHSHLSTIVGSMAVVNELSVSGPAAVAGGGVTEEEKKKEDEKKQTVGDAFIVALGTAAALFVVKYAGSAVSALIGWAQDKMFAPQSVNVGFDAAGADGTVPDGATGVIEFRGHDGVYEMEWDLLLRQ